MAHYGRRKVQWRDRDLGWERIRREIRKSANKPHVQVGIFGAKASADHGGLPNVVVATTHEFGETIEREGKEGSYIIEIPERSFIRATVDVRRRQIRGTARTVADRVLTGALSRKQALDQLGLFVQGQIRQRISEGIPPPNKPATEQRKGSSTPLIDKGQLRASIDFESKNT
jgi:hypothetical protein